MLSGEKEGVSRGHGAWWWLERRHAHLAADTNGVVAGKREFGLVVDLDRLEFVSVGVSLHTVNTLHAIATLLASAHAPSTGSATRAALFARFSQ